MVINMLKMENIASPEIIKDEAMERIAVTLYKKRQEKENKCEILILTGCGPLCGTTTTTHMVAKGLVNAGCKVLVIDCDYRKAKQDDSQKNGLADVLLQNKKIQNTIVKMNEAEFDYMPMGHFSGSVISVLGHESMGDTISTLQEIYDFVLIDVPPVTIMEESLLLMPYVDGIIMVAGIYTAMKQQIANAKMILSKYGEQYYGMIVNKVEQDEYHRMLKDYHYLEKKKFAFHISNLMRKKEVSK